MQRGSTTSWLSAVHRGSGQASLWAGGLGHLSTGGHGAIPSRGGEGEFYLIVSAFAPYKRLDLAVQACNALRRPLKIVGTGQDERKLRVLAGPTVEFLGPRSDAGNC